MQYNPQQAAFSAGEISPKAKGRSDLNQYSIGADTLVNYIVQPQGGVYRRSGSRYVAEVKNSANFTRMVEFKFSQLQAYTLEFGNLYVRFYRSGGQLVTGGSPVEVTTPYISSDLPALKYVQSNDVLYLVHPKYPPAMLSRLSDTSWTYTVIPFTDGPYFTQGYYGTNIKATVGTTITASATTGTTTLTASNPVFTATTDIGRQVQILVGATWGVATITAVASTTSATATVNFTMGGTTASTTWAFGAFSATSGYPSVVTFHDQRLCFFNTPSQPQTFFLSNTGDFYNFTPVSGHTTTVVDTNAVVYTLGDTQENTIVWADSGASNLLLGTIGAEWRVEAGTAGGSITPTSIQVLPQTTYGSVPNLRQHHVGYAIIYVQRSQRRVREMTYQFAIDAFASQDISFLGEHLFRYGNGVADSAYQPEPDSNIWYLTNTGALIAFTYVKDESIKAFTQVPMGASLAGPAVVESVAVIPSIDGTQDQLWMIVKRTINGAVKRYVEYVEIPFDPGLSTTTNGTTTATNAYFVDCGITYSGTATNKITSGFSHLVGETVQVIGDGSVRDSVTVASDGSITISGKAATNISAGLFYPSLLKTLPPDGGSRNGTAQGKTKRAQRFVIRLLNTLGLEISADGIYWETVSFRDTSNLMDQAPPLFTGDLLKYGSNTYDLYGVFWFRQSNPYPSSILAIFPEEVVY